MLNGVVIFLIEKMNKMLVIKSAQFNSLYLVVVLKQATKQATGRLQAGKPSKARQANEQAKTRQCRDYLNICRCSL
jgi:hypothetical protein